MIKCPSTYIHESCERTFLTRQQSHLHVILFEKILTNMCIYNVCVLITIRWRTLWTHINTYEASSSSHTNLTHWRLINIRLLYLRDFSRVCNLLFWLRANSRTTNRKELEVWIYRLIQNGYPGQNALLYTEYSNCKIVYAHLTRSFKRNEKISDYHRNDGY